MSPRRILQMNPKHILHNICFTYEFTVANDRCPGRLIGRRRIIEWPPSDFSPLDFFLKSFLYNTISRYGRFVKMCNSRI